MMNSSAVVTTTSDNTGIKVVNRDRDAANMYIHNERSDVGREASPDSIGARSASIDSITSISQTAHQTSATMSSMEETPAKKRRKQSNPVRYGQTAPTNILPMAIDEDVPEEEEDDESLIAAGLRVTSQLQRSASFSSSDDDSNLDEDIDEEQALELDRSRKVSQQLLQQSVMNFHKFQMFCPHCKCPFNNDDDLRCHIEEEHVQKLLERQLFQHQQQLNHKSSIMNGPNQLRASLSDLCKFDQNQHKYNSSDSQTSSSSGSNNNSPLQSPSDRKPFETSHPHGPSDPTGKEFASNFLPFQMPPNMPPLIPMSQSSGMPTAASGEGAKSGQSSSPGAAPLHMAMFPNPMAPFLFPIPMGTNSGSNGSAMSANMTNMTNGGQQVSSGGVRIFNPEAYCELCNKEFCNKYFLKTHKANKHGIYSMDTLVGPQGYGSPFFPSTMSNSSTTTPTAAAAAAALQMQQILQSSAGLTPTSEALVVSTPVRSNVINMESYCEICQKEFCNKYFLKKHKQKIHGIADPHNPQQSSQQSSSASPGSCSNEPQVKMPTPSPPLASASLSLPISTSTSLIPVSTPVSISTSSTPASERPLQMATPLMVSSQTSSPTNNFVCEICKQEFQNLISLQTHRFTTHYPAMHAMANVSSAPPPAPSLQTMTASAVDSLGVNRSASGHGSGLPETGNFVFTADKLREMGVINADAFCEICCKEFCNKYFLRTHKTNKHGMSFDSNSSTKSQSGRNSNDNKGDDSNNDDNEDSFLEPGQRDPASYANGSDFFNAMSAGHSDLQCELCSRPFASHYLLRMHKFYSHNIPYIKEEDIRKSMAASPCSEVPNEHKMSVSDTGHVGRRGTEPAGQSSEGESNGAPDTNADQASQDLQKLQTMIKELNSSSYLDKAFCHLCRQEFENKYFLRVHMMNDHGVIADEPSPLESSALMKSFLEVNRSQFPMVSSGLQSGDSQAFCDICQKDFCSKYFLKTHKQNMHGIYEGPPTPTESTPPTFPGHTSPHAFPLHRKSSEEAVNLAMTPNKDKSRLSQPLQPLQSLMPSKQMPAVVSVLATQSGQIGGQMSGQMSGETKPQPRNPTGRNYCNICNKELCNKYFMKTHMLKMHGINIDEHPMEASANSTIGGVTCDICQKELCSKYFLKVHKQNTHGIYEDPPQTKETRTSESSSNPIVTVNNNDRDTQAHGIDPNDTNNRYFSHYTEVCPLCERRFKSIKWLKTHMINDHSDIVSMRPTDLSITGPNADMSRLCILCGQTFPDRVALHIHLVKEHRTTAEELGISGNVSGMKAMPTSATDLSLKSEQIPISLQLSQHLSSQQSIQSSRVNGSISPLSQTSAGMVSALSHHSHLSHGAISQANNSLSKMMGIGSTATIASMLSTSPVPTTAIASIQSIVNPLNSTNLNADTNNTIYTNNISTNNSNKNLTNNNTNSEANSNTGVASNSMPTGVITCAALSTALTSSGTTRCSVSSSPTAATTLVNEERSSSLLSGPEYRPIIKRTGCGTRIYQCSYCNYATRWLSNLYAHEKRHTRLNTEADKKFVCRVCHRAYRYNHSLQRHLLNHRSGGLNGRDVSAIALLSSNSKGLLSGGLRSGSDKFSGLDSKFSRLFPSGSHSSLHKTLVGRPNRVKRYRCSKCNKKFRTRDLCLSHIHVYHSDSRKIILTSASGKVTTKVCRCSYCGFTTRNFALLKIHINKNHPKLTIPATDLATLAHKGHEMPLNLRKSLETAANSLANKMGSAASPGSSDEEGMGGSGCRASGQTSAESPQLPMTYAMPQSPPTAGSFIMQPFLITQPDAEGPLTNDTFVPSLVYLPVSHKVLQPVRVAFHLTPA